MWKRVDPYQQRAEWKAGRIEVGEKVSAPMHATEQRAREEVMSRQETEEIKRDLETKHKRLAENLGKINIRSSGPTAPPDSSLPRIHLPHTPPTEVEHPGGEPAYEFGFYEPPPDRMEPGRLTFREALEVLRRRMEIEPGDETQEVGEQQRKEAQAYLDSHPATQRVSAESMERIWSYFRPFDAQRKREQTVIAKQYIDELNEAIEDSPAQKLPTIPTMLSAISEKINERPVIMSERDTQFDHIDEGEARRLKDAMEQREKAERKRLAKRFEDLKALDAEVQREKVKEQDASAGADPKEGKKEGSAGAPR